MKTRGGYAVAVHGKPAAEIATLSSPGTLCIPLRTARLHFSDVSADHGARIDSGSVLARDPDHYNVPLLSPACATVDRSSVPGHIVLTAIAPDPGKTRGAPRTAADPRVRIVDGGAWHYFSDAFTGEIPDPSIAPQALVVSTTNLEPFLVRGDALLSRDPDGFVHGLERLQSLLEYQPIILAVPRVQAPLARQIRDRVKGFAWIRIVETPLRYPFHHFRLIARLAGLRHSPDKGPVWALRVDGVLAVAAALSGSDPCRGRIIAVGGPGVRSASHVEVPYGYPVSEIISQLSGNPSSRVVRGGVFTGTECGETFRGIDPECEGLFVMDVAPDREFLGFMRPGWDRRSYSRCFLSTLRPSFGEKTTGTLRGEKRPCVACGFCADVCPSRLLPYLIHKGLYRDALEEVEKARPDLCIGCGLCSYVCPSKIELREEILGAHESIRRLSLEESQHSL